MKRRIEKVVVLGAGTMGARIAAHFANAGVPVLLLDIVPPGIARRAPRSATKLCAPVSTPRKNPSPPPFLTLPLADKNLHRKFRR